MRFGEMSFKEPSVWGTVLRGAVRQGIVRRENIFGELSDEEMSFRKLF